MSGKAYERIKESVLTELVVCDTIPLKENMPHEKIKVLTVENIFATAIRNAYEFKSINSLFV
jgi:ribose-phosphate pyrophosphokinase